MQAQTLTPAALFGNQVRYVVPLFQRPYVWTREAQWESLWQDVCGVAERILETLPPHDLAGVAPHFLGAVVVEQEPTLVGFIDVRRVIDGQQRLTTLQVLLDAARVVASRHGRVADANGLAVLVANPSGVTQDPDEVFKVWPTDRDQAAFRTALTPAAPAAAALAAAPAAAPGRTAVPVSLIGRAHAYFVSAISDWCLGGAGKDSAARRVTALTQALRDCLKLVVISLDPTDNAQVIFETLNHRGAPLLAADLIKNFIFQRAQRQQLDVRHLYESFWIELDNDYWRQRVARGRQYVPRIDIFMNYWLVIRLKREVASDQIFAEFRRYVEDNSPSIEGVLAELWQASRTYRHLDQLPETSVEGTFRYRVLQAMDSAAVTPVLLWLLGWPSDRIADAQRHRALGALESWLVRRALCRLTAKDTTKLVVDLIKTMSTNDPARAGDVVERYLLDQTADSRFWPPDAMVAEALKDAPVYKTFARARLRMLLEAAEDRFRTEKGEGTRCPRDLTVEHVMPQAWREYWGGDVDGVGAAGRDRLVHTLGNLTLLTGKLNPSLSNKPWTDRQAAALGLGSHGKREDIQRHSELKINLDLILRHRDAWTDDAIRARTAQLTAILTSIWPRPAAGAQPAVTLRTAEKETAVPIDDEVETAVDGYTGKYRALSEWLAAQSADALPVTFDELEDILGFGLPASARRHAPFWSSTNSSLAKSIRNAGFKPTGISIADEKVIFKRLPRTS